MAWWPEPPFPPRLFGSPAGGRTSVVPGRGGVVAHPTDIGAVAPKKGPGVAPTPAIGPRLLVADSPIYVYPAWAHHLPPWKIHASPPPLRDQSQPVRLGLPVTAVTVALHGIGTLLPLHFTDHSMVPFQTRKGFPCRVLPPVFTVWLPAPSNASRFSSRPCLAAIGPSTPKFQAWSGEDWSVTGASRAQAPQRLRDDRAP